MNRRHPPLSFPKPHFVLSRAPLFAASHTPTLGKSFVGLGSGDVPPLLGGNQGWHSAIAKIHVRMAFRALERCMALAVQGLLGGIEKCCSLGALVEHELAELQRVHGLVVRARPSHYARLRPSRARRGLGSPRTGFVRLDGDLRRTARRTWQRVASRQPPSAQSRVLGFSATGQGGTPLHLRLWLHVNATVDNQEWASPWNVSCVEQGSPKYVCLSSCSLYV